MEKRLIFAIALSILIIMLFQNPFVRPPQVPKPAPAVEAQQTLPSSVGKEEISAQPEKSLLAAEKITGAETNRYFLTFSNIGGSIKGIKLKDYKAPDSNEPLDLAEVQNPREYILSIESPLSKSPLNLAAYEESRKDNVVAYSLKTDDFQITKKYILHNTKYGIELQLFVKNISSQPREFSYRIIGGAGVKEYNERDKAFLETLAKINGKIVKLKKPKDERIITPGLVDWTAIKTKYFSIILKPFNSKSQFYSENKKSEIVTGIESNPILIQPGMSIEEKFVLFAGPSHISVLKEFGYDLEETIDYGFFGGISKALIVVMRFFYSVVHSWGLSIILLAVFLNIILFPLTRKSLTSIQRMQELHPEMEKIKAKNKDNPQKLNKEIMELYKKYKINPFSGCLPMLLQMPIFFALYQALMKSIELRNTKFLWIKDLSSPDALKLPLTLPVIGNSINILPIVMAGAMVLQQKLSTASMGAAVSEEQKQQQKMMLVIMPVMFGVIFYNMPSGLVLYWFMNTMLTIVEQMFIFRKD